MKVSPRKVPSAKQMAQVEPVPPATPKRLVAPIAGWVLNESLAATSPRGARRLDNWICGQSTIRVRKGTSAFATIAADRVWSLFTYQTGSVSKLFASSDDSIFDITSPASATVIPTPAVRGLSGGEWHTQQFATAGGEFLVAVNGSDVAMRYDGTGWNPVNGATVNQVAYDALSTDFAVGETVTGGTSGASATIVAIMPTSATAGVLKLGAITSGPFSDNEALTSASGSATADGGSSEATTVAITGVTTSALSHVWSHASRLWFVEEGTQSAWYLPVDSVGGAASEFSLAGTFRKGGALMFGASWSTDAGDGMNDQCVFVSTLGEVAIYQGTNPASASEWALVGIYEIEKPLGKKAVMKAGGDLLIATEVGLVPLSEAMRRDVAALSLGAVSRAIEPEWRRQAASLTTVPWQIAKWPTEGIMIVTQPESAVTLGTCLVANMQTGAWSRFTGIDTQSIAVLGDDAYFGTSGGVVGKFESGGQDGTTPYTASYLGQPEPLDLPGVQKTMKLARPIIISDTPVVAQFGALTDYREILPPPPNTSDVQPTDGWDVSTWDVSVWDASSGDGLTATDSQWISVGATGYAHAPVLQMTFGSAAAPSVEYIGADVTVQAGALVA